METMRILQTVLKDTRDTLECMMQNGADDIDIYEKQMEIAELEEAIKWEVDNE